VLLNLDVKKALPEEGVKYLHVRLQAKQIKNGRFDLEIVVMDEGGELVALSHHVCFAVSAARNTAARRTVTAGETKL
jgi:acyl-CoA thioesterase FadM